MVGTAQMETPFFAIGEGEIQDAPTLGSKIVCSMCGKTHNIRHGEKEINGKRVKSKRLAYYKCRGEAYLAGINGKDIRGSFEKGG